MIAKFNWVVSEDRIPNKRNKIITTKGYCQIKEEMNNREISKIWRKNKPFEDHIVNGKKKLMTF